MRQVTDDAIRFRILLQFCGLSQPETAAILAVPKSTVENFVNGKSRIPPGVLVEMEALADKIEQIADTILDVEDEQRPDQIELPYPASDDAARDMGLPTASSWRAMAAIVLRTADCEVVFVPKVISA